MGAAEYVGDDEHGPLHARVLGRDAQETQRLARRWQTLACREIHTCVMALPQGYEAALVVNSQPGGACGVLLDSYKDAAG